MGNYRPRRRVYSGTHDPTIGTRVRGLWDDIRGRDSSFYGGREKRGYDEAHASNPSSPKTPKAKRTSKDRRTTEKVERKTPTSSTAPKEAVPKAGKAAGAESDPAPAPTRPLSFQPYGGFDFLSYGGGAQALPPSNAPRAMPAPWQAPRGPGLGPLPPPVAPPMDPAQALQMIPPEVLLKLLLGG